MIVTSRLCLFSTNVCSSLIAFSRGVVIIQHILEMFFSNGFLFTVCIVCALGKSVQSCSQPLCYEMAGQVSGMPAGMSFPSMFPFAGGTQVFELELDLDLDLLFVVRISYI